MLLLQDFLISAKLLWCGRFEEGGCTEEINYKEGVFAVVSYNKFLFLSEKNKTMKTK